MGREANCECTWADRSGHCKVLLEGSELILRGAIKRKVPLTGITDLAVTADQLTFRVDRQQVAVTLGMAAAQRWAKAMTAAPPTLAHKLGIASTTRLHRIGASPDDELNAAIQTAGFVTPDAADLAIACAETPEGLERALKQYLSRPDRPPLWIVYPKGRGSPLPEPYVREILRGLHFIDTKIASVSKTLTALRFNKRRGSP